MSLPVTILEAMEHPELFGPFFRGDSWKPWKAFLAALFGLPMSEDQLALYRQHTARTAPPLAPFKEAELVVGRRGGKSRILALLGVYLGAFFDYAPNLAPGEVATIAIIAADRKQARTVFRFVKGLLNAVPSLAAMVQEETAETITLNNRVVIEIATASFRVTRGYTFAALLADETAFWRSDDSANPDSEIIRAVRPGLSTITGAILLNASSPYRRTGLLWNTFQRHYGKDDARVLVWKASTAEMNPGIDPAIIQEAYEDDPESAPSEFGGDFRTDLADFVTRAAVEACIEPGVIERPFATAAGQYSCFLDAAGGSGSDSMTMAIAYKHDGIATLAAVRERKPPFSPEDVVQEFAGLMKTYHIRTAQSDKWGGSWVTESFSKHGITVTPSALPKSDIYREILPLLNGRRCALLDNARLVQQFCGLERRVSRSGKDSIDSAPNAHEDLANAAAGALHMVGVARPPMRFSPELLAAISNPYHRSESPEVNAMLDRIGPRRRPWG